MTTKVVKGSMWTLGGSVLPLAVSFISTPFIIRFLGAEGYGVLLLVNLIPMYFNFADFGMGVASTKFASEAYGNFDREQESRVVWTATTIAAVSVSLVVVPIILFSFPIVAALNVPEHLLAEASVALKVSAATFTVGVLTSVLNSPMLARLRMDLVTASGAFTKVLAAAVIPIILFFGGGIVAAVSWTFIVAILSLAMVFYFSGRLLPEVFKPAFDMKLLTSLVRFGASWFVAMVAAILLVNLEKILLTKMVSIEALAYYSVAFTVANMAAMFSQAMSQSMLPAFSQLMTPEKRREFDALFGRGIRFNIIWLLPALMVMILAAESFFRLWAGEEFGRQSTLPFYVLLTGLFFNILAYIPHAAITASGRTDIFAKLYWIELAIYGVLAWLLIGRFGIIGAAMAWSARIFLDAFVVIALSKRVTGTKFKFFSKFGVLLFAAGALVVPILLSALGIALELVITAAALALGGYAIIIWNLFVDAGERGWIKTFACRAINRS